MKLLYFDLETTGTNPGKNGIHQISGMIEIDGEEKEKFDFHVQPNPAAIIEQQALDVADVTSALCWNFRIKMVVNLMLKTFTNKNYSECAYTVGEIVKADSWDKNRWDECSHGIHFFIDRQSAVDY